APGRAGSGICFTQTMTFMTGILVACAQVHTTDGAPISWA
ncbi:MAG: hypothetical protein RL550_962, partial [Actinomycetota bacterium]